MRRVTTLEEAQTAINEIWNVLDTFKSKNIDMSKRRIVNASPSIDLYDYVVRKELIQRTGEGTTTTTTTTTTLDHDHRYTIVFTNNGTLRVGSPAAPAYIMKRESILLQISITAEVPPRTGEYTEFNFYYDDNLINAEDIRIEHDYPSFAILNYSNFYDLGNYTTDKLIKLDVLSSGHMKNVTVEFFMEEV